ncbi:MAG: alpha/beta hydrolase-fold protein [Acetatifactor sp.]|nr:alpha/beta hydrolase-fold protein [Acetatifactor sp.]
MAVAHIEYFSAALWRPINIKAIIPTDAATEGNKHFERPAKLFILLHGYAGASGDWLYSSKINEYAAKYNLCVILPSGENSFYLDGEATGRKYARFVGQELPDFAKRSFGLKCEREDIFIGGLSMGGYGALHTALAYPETFGAAIGLSSALIHGAVEQMEPGTDNGVANYEYYELMFGKKGSSDERAGNLEAIVRKLKAEKKQFPRIYMACGTEDFLYERNKAFEAFLSEEQVEHTFMQSPGVHDFVFWNQYLEPSIRWFLKEEE